MKNYYELTEQEHQKFIKEYNKTEYCKKINNIRLITAMLLIFGTIGYYIIYFIAEEEKLNVTDLLIWMEFLGIILLAIFIIYTIILVITRMRYLRIKHNIEF